MLCAPVHSHWDLIIVNFASLCPQPGVCLLQPLMVNQTNFLVVGSRFWALATLLYQVSRMQSESDIVYKMTVFLCVCITSHVVHPCSSVGRARDRWAHCSETARTYNVLPLLHLSIFPIIFLTYWSSYMYRAALFWHILDAFWAQRKYWCSWLDICSGQISQHCSNNLTILIYSGWRKQSMTRLLW